MKIEMKIEMKEEEIDMISNSMQNILENRANSPQGYNDLVNRVLKTNFKAQELTKGVNCVTKTEILNQPCF